MCDTSAACVCACFVYKILDSVRLCVQYLYAVHSTLCICVPEFGRVAATLWLRSLMEFLCSLVWVPS